MSFFISSAYAQADAAAAPSGVFNFIFFGGFALIFYFLIWRPQSKRAKEHKDLMGSLGKGDEVMTNGGLLGKLVKVDDSYTRHLKAYVLIHRSFSVAVDFVSGSWR